MTIEIKRILKCDDCGRHLDTDALTKKELELALACSDGWIKKGNKHYCPECKDKVVTLKMKKYDKNATCLKCGYGGIADEHSDKINPAHKPKPAYIARSCKNCGYLWKEGSLK